MFIDATHVKARCKQKVIPQAEKNYEKQPFEEINNDKEGNGKLPFYKKDNPVKDKTVTVSTTGFDSGVFHNCILFPQDKVLFI